MFGHVEFEIQAAPGQGIVSSAVLMSDVLDEIDWEWLGGDNDQVQSNYFRKGQITVGYNRGAFHAISGTHDGFHKYAIDWTAEQIVWSIDGQTVRVLEAGNAQNGDYPQTPMQIKVGSWAGGDPGNPQGTIEWAGGLTTYTDGPFTMYLKSIAVTDYSTGTAYTYSGTTGDWESIQSDGGSINPAGSGQPVATADQPAITSTVPNDSSAPLAFDPSDSASVYATRTGWPWTGTATASVVPPGWSIDGNGNIHPPSSGAVSMSSSAALRTRN
jgi:beta-glucanase (GH16 family)